MAGAGDPGRPSSQPGPDEGFGLLPTVGEELTHRAARSRGDPTELVGNPSVGEVRLPSRPESAGAARRLTHAVLFGHWALPPQLTEHAVLLVSELVGNAVRHTGADVFGLRILRRPGRVRIEVRDPSRALPCRLPVREMDVSGRGLFLVDLLCDRWGVDLLPRGKTTWFEIRY